MQRGLLRERAFPLGLPSLFVPPDGLVRFWLGLGRGPLVRTRGGGLRRACAPRDALNGAFDFAPAEEAGGGLGAEGGECVWAAEEACAEGVDGRRAE